MIERILIEIGKFNIPTIIPLIFINYFDSIKFLINVSPSFMSNYNVTMIGFFKFNNYLREIKILKT